jgi:hypothetical protein
MKIEELEGMSYPFKVRITKGNRWYKNRVGEEFWIVTGVSNAQSKHYFYTYGNTPASVCIDNELRRFNYVTISSNDCELVKDEPAYEPSVTSIKEVYKNLTEEDLRQGTFVRPIIETVELIIEEYGLVWFSLTEDIEWSLLKGDTNMIGYSKGMMWKRSLDSLCFPFHNWSQEQVSKLEVACIVQFAKCKIFDPSLPENQKILQKKIDREILYENMPKITYTQEIVLY